MKFIELGFHGLRVVNSLPTWAMTRVASLANCPSSARSRRGKTILFVPGGWEPAECFDSTTKYFASKGFTSAVVAFSHGKSVCGQVTELKRIVKDLGPSNVVLVGYSLSGFIVQKFVESNSCAGFVLVNSLPPSPQSSLNRLLGVRDLAEFDNALKKLKYCGIFQSLLDAPVLPLSESVLLNPFENETIRHKVQASVRGPETELVRDIYSQSVIRSNGLIPALVVHSSEDRFVTDEDALSTSKFHSCEKWNLPNAPHLINIVSSEAVENFQERLLAWLNCSFAETDTR